MHAKIIDEQLTFSGKCRTRVGPQRWMRSRGPFGLAKPFYRSQPDIATANVLVRALSQTSRLVCNGRSASACRINGEGTDETEVSWDSCHTSPECVSLSGDSRWIGSHRKQQASSKARFYWNARKTTDGSEGHASSATLWQSGLKKAQRYRIVELCPLHSGLTKGHEVMSSWSRIEKTARLAPKQARPKYRRRLKKSRPDKKLCTVYALADGFGDIRYIGQTQITMERRFKFHMNYARKNPGRALSEWLLEAPRQIVAMDENATWNVSEIIWIDRLRTSGLKLFNQLRGGTDTIHAVSRENAQPRDDWWNDLK